jgi:hypothetical protein
MHCHQEFPSASALAGERAGDAAGGDPRLHQDGARTGRGKRGGLRHRADAVEPGDPGRARRAGGLETGERLVGDGDDV